MRRRSWNSLRPSSSSGLGNVALARTSGIGKAREAVEQRRLPRIQESAPPVRCATSPSRRTRWNFRRSMRRMVAPYFDVYHLHVRCYSTWELVRTKVDGHPPS